MQIVALISLCDFMANLAAFFPMGSNCTFHGMWYFFFFGASYNWTIILSYLLYGVATKGRVPLTYSKMHIIAWTLAVGRAILPLTSATYQNQDMWCSIEDKPGYSSSWVTVWNVVDFLFWIGFTFVAIVFLRLRLAWLVHKNVIQYTPTVKVAIETMDLYPLALIICWFLRYVMDCGSISGHRLVQKAGTLYLQTIVQVLYTLHGAAVAVIFFLKSNEARDRWYILLSKYWRRWFPSEDSVKGLIPSLADINGVEDLKDPVISYDADVTIGSDGQFSQFQEASKFRRNIHSVELSRMKSASPSKPTSSEP